MSQEKPQLPDGSYAITREDKLKIQAFGRKLHALVIQESKENPDFQVKIMYGGIDYLNEIITQKRKLANESLTLVQKMMEEGELHNKLEEPFSPEPETPEVPDAKILDAAVAPSAGPEIAGIPSPMQPNIEGVGEEDEDGRGDGSGGVPVMA